MNNLLPWVLALYVVVGAATGVGLARKGQPWATALSAVVAWPLLVGLQGPAGGPHALRIHAAFSALEQALRDPAAQGLISAMEIEELRRSLLHVDQRIGLVDRLLADPAVAANGEPLRRARERAMGELDASLHEIVQLRVQLGLVALAGDTAPVRARMGALSARVRALEELGLVADVGQAPAT